LSTKQGLEFMVLRAFVHKTPQDGEKSHEVKTFDCVILKQGFLKIIWVLISYQSFRHLSKAHPKN